MRYLIGIDLGTTNTCVAYADTTVAHMPIQNFKVPQLISPGYLQEQPTLPSSCYMATANEWPSPQLDLPWRKNPDYFVGQFAKDYGSRVPTRLISSAKSWLCLSTANRKDKILPYEADAQLKISPVEASARYLLHIREAWNHLMAKGDVENEFESQEVILTVPASFDEVARSLTVEAAKLAGFTQVTLLEEPQAAFYSWIAQNEKSGLSLLYPGAVILVCDIGGGTTDFTLIEVVETEGKLGFQRLSVGNHLLLGGDNMDAALAYYIEEKMKASLSNEITHVQWLQMLHQARLAKEALLAINAPASFRIVLQGSGSQVIQNSLTLEIAKEEVQDLLLKGFWGVYDWAEALSLRKGSGMRSLGLPYEEEPSITKHLAQFLSRCKHHTNKTLKPDFVLFNGGAVKPDVFQNAIMESLVRWFPEKHPKILDSYHLDLAVARGAVYYGKVKQGLGVRIGGGSPRAYYFAVETHDAPGSKSVQAITLVPRRAEEGSSFELPDSFWVLPNAPVAFKMYSSNVRLNDQLGDMVSIDPQEMQLLPPIHTLLRFGKGALHDTLQEKIPVHLGVTLTPIGTLEVWLKSQKSHHRWTLEFQLRKHSGQENSLSLLEEKRQDETFDAEYIAAGQKVIRQFFQGEVYIKPAQIMECLEKALERPRQSWSLSVLRGLWEELYRQAPQRGISQEKEARWWNLAGFFLRPGYGYPLDDQRIKELWKIILADTQKDLSPECLLQHWICYRRIAGGLNKGQQMQLASDLMASILPKKQGKIDIKNKKDLNDYREKIRSLGAMELLDISIKEKLGQALIDRIESGDYSSADLWALGRLGARHLVYGSMANVIHKDICTRWIMTLLEKCAIDAEALSFLLGQLARKTSVRELNLPEDVLQKILKHFDSTPQSERLKALLFDHRDLTKDEQELIFGDNLPIGLSIIKGL